MSVPTDITFDPVFVVVPSNAASGTVIADVIVATDGPDEGAFLSVDALFAVDGASTVEGGPKIRLIRDLTSDDEGIHSVSIKANESDVQIVRTLLVRVRHGS